MREKLTPYLKKLAHHPGIERQYVMQESGGHQTSYNDPLLEDEHEVVKGLVHKYPNRALIKVSYQCAAHCRFCTRIRQIGNASGTLKQPDLLKIKNYLEHHPEIEDVILSGGDPFLTPKLTLSLLELIWPIKSVKVMRIGSRLALQAPKSIKNVMVKEVLAKIKEIGKRKPFYILLHVNHPDELSEEAILAIKSLKNSSGATLLSQTVFLQGVNMDFNVLHQLFKQLYFTGVIPYYLYHCDQVKGLEKFTGDIEVEKSIMRKLRTSLSGIAYPTYIVDLEEDFGKFPVDLGMVITKGKKAKRCDQAHGHQEQYAVQLESDYTDKSRI
jgi:lysine 2,3-aminomutase